jgi:hypothetical protein
MAEMDAVNRNKASKNVDFFIVIFLCVFVETSRRLLGVVDLSECNTLTANNTSRRQGW